MRKRRLIYNTASSLIYQAVAIICSFILPRAILSFFGSEVNGLTNSISQFLSVISFLDLGVGSVVRSSLYKPLADENNKDISKVVASASKFFRRLAGIMLVYIAALMIFYPLIVNQNFGFVYTATLIAAMSISMLSQYYLGVVNRMLLLADQRGYIQYNAQTVTVVLNTAACVALIRMGATIQLVKLTTSLIFTLRPLYLYWFVNKHYCIDRKIRYEGEPIKQKWNGMAQHISAVVLDGTDSIVLSIFASLSDVSIYSVYHLVLNGIKQMVMSMTNGIQSLLGELWAKQELEELNKAFAWTEWVIHTGVTFVFGCAGVLILPFVSVYTHGIEDTNYLQPLFAFLIVAANAGHCLRLPYNIMILAAGRYKETQSNYIIATVMNILISVFTVKLWGLVGVAIGTLIAMVYQTVWMAWYNSKHLLCWPFYIFLKQIAVDCLTVLLAALSSCWLVLPAENYLGWIVLAVLVAAIWGIEIVVLNAIFYRDMVQKLYHNIKKRVVRGRK